ncbi:MULTISPECIES: multidrug effflux MFS transporter [unclassified Mesorhizobium]|uniref:multidrug effflux MFS transporter n=1 Tax=unclassified Mesorhizobium TaxID=325217 RepID=UPI0006FA1F60|nr:MULTISPECIES: multidrug effflux MFS transporter [unclassified Mesorhizobium]KQZ13124.1 MFS transporter [Mesorhizobium sp. Root1471]KQZ35640.1 MFS transporter [Mesorhizobium sp. Root554]MDR7031910.1 DHA1 family bicyclomycin/chloramphenicol resistance-like MFS transporter [Mesorhizobium sp. BE184]
MDTPSQVTEPQGALSIPRWEFITLCAALMALNALAIDILLPALQHIGESLGVENENHRQYVIPAYIFGFSIAQIVFGPLSDRFGRRGPLLIGLAIYILAAAAATVAPTFETLLICRVIQGVGAAGTRVISVSIVRDVFAGRRMAEVMSLIFMVFMAVPVIAPSIGQVIMLFASWHFIFLVMAAGALASALWVMFRLPETLHAEYKRPLTAKSVLGGFRIVITNRVTFCYTIASTLAFGAMFGFITSVQQIYVGLYGLGQLFPVVFAVMAGMLSLTNLANSQLVGRYGMRLLSQGALCVMLVISLIWVLLSLWGPIPLPIFLTIVGGIMVPFALLGTNFNALAMEPLGRLAGTASSFLGSMQTFGGGLFGTIVGQSYNGTVTPLALGFLVMAIGGLAMVAIAEKGRMFTPHNHPV